MYTEDENFIKECRTLLLKSREETLNHLTTLNDSLKENQKDDSAGMAMNMQDETYRLSRGKDLSLRLKQIDEALARIDSKNYGYCVETGEPIEKERLLAIPWTLLSSGGAELIERKNR